MATEDLTEKTLAARRVFTGKLISVDVLDIELPDGRRTTREVVRHGAAVGILEPGESPEAAARRETAEETGHDVARLERLTTIVCTPGYCEERIHLFYAEVQEKPHGQHQDPDENVHPVVLDEAEVEAAIRGGTLFDSKSLSAWACWKLRA